MQEIQAIHRLLPLTTLRIMMSVRPILGIPKGNKLSAAMKRAMKWENHDNKWFFEYKMEPLKR